MSKAKKSGEVLITDALVEKVKAVIEESKKHTYSVSRVYAAYNEAMGKNDAPESCSTCLTSRVAELVVWLKGFESGKGGDTKKDDTPKVAKDAPEPTGIEAIAFKYGLPPYSVLDVSPDVELDSLNSMLSIVDLTDDERAQVVSRIEAITEAVANAGNKAGVEPTVYTLKEGGAKIVFTPNADDATKGTVKASDDKAVKPGKYETDGGATIAVQPGGKATLKEEDLT